MTTMPTDVAVHQAPTTEHAQSQKGNALVEFALILPVFLLLLFGVVTFSLALYNKTVFTMATREGARAGTRYVANRTNTIIASSAKAAALQACHSNLISFGPEMTPIVTTTIEGKILTVTAKGDYTGLFIFSDVILISAQTSMRLE